MHRLFRILSKDKGSTRKVLIKAYQEVNVELKQITSDLKNIEKTIGEDCKEEKSIQLSLPESLKKERYNVLVSLPSDFVVLG